MSNEIKFHIKEDTVSDYLNQITEKVDSQAEEHMKEMARLLTGKNGIYQYITRWNDNLRESGKDESKWVFSQNENGASITVEYTGVTPKSYASDFMVWWEFAKEYGGKYIPNPEDRTLGRDYAYFQETGIDPIVKANVPRRNLNYVEKGIDARHKIIVNKSAGYIKNILANRR